MLGARLWVTPLAPILAHEGFLAPSPMTAKEEATSDPTSDPSPCPLPVGEGWQRRRQRITRAGSWLRSERSGQQKCSHACHARGVVSPLPPGEGCGADVSAQNARVQDCAPNATTDHFE